MNTSKFNLPIICDESNPDFNFFLGYYLALIDSVLSLLASNKSQVARTLFSSVFETDLPDTDETSLNNLDYTRIFQGPLSIQTTDLYQNMMQTWMDIQRDGMGGQNPLITDVSFESSFKSFHRILSDLRYH